jgi:hypothetical protein
MAVSIKLLVAIALTSLITISESFLIRDLNDVYNEDKFGIFVKQQSIGDPFNCVAASRTMIAGAYSGCWSDMSCDYYKYYHRNPTKSWSLHQSINSIPKVNGFNTKTKVKGPYNSENPHRIFHCYQGGVTQFVNYIYKTSFNLDVDIMKGRYDLSELTKLSKNYCMIHLEVSLGGNWVPHWLIPVLTNVGGSDDLYLIDPLGSLSGPINVNGNPVQKVQDYEPLEMTTITVNEVSRSTNQLKVLNTMSEYKFGDSKDGKDGFECLKTVSHKDVWSGELPSSIENSRAGVGGKCTKLLDKIKEFILRK